MTARIIPAASVVVELDDVMIDQLCFQYLFSVLRDRSLAGRIRGYVEATLAANPSLADRAVVLPRGLKVALPEFIIESEVRGTVRLWDD